MIGTRPRILIAEDHIFLAELCKKVLDREFDVVGIVTDGRAMVREASRLKPDLILVDIRKDSGKSCNSWLRASA